MRDLTPHPIPALSKQLRFTGTLCWVVPDQLVVLFDPKRQRLCYVLAVPHGDQKSEAISKVQSRVVMQFSFLVASALLNPLSDHIWSR